MFEKLLIDELPPKNEDGEPLCTKLIKKKYFEVKGSYADFINETSTNTKYNILKSLHSTGLKSLLMYRDLIKLDKNIDLTSYKSNSFANVNQDLIPEKFQEKILLLSSENKELFSHTDNLLYKGGIKLNDLPTEEILSYISIHLLDSLRIIRSHTHRLD